MERVKEFYFKEEASGAIPLIRVAVNGEEIIVLDKLSIKHGSTNKDYVIYPSKLNIDFTANEQFKLGDEVEVRLYYKGQRWDGLDYYDWPATPLSNVFKARITSRNYNPLTIKTGGFWDYKCEENFSEITEKVSVGKNETLKDIIGRVSFLNSYEGNEEAKIATADEYGLDVILSDLAKYRSFQLRDEGKNAIVEIKDKKVLLREITNNVVLTCDVYTVSNSVAYSQTAKELIQSVYWEKGATIKDLDLAGLVKDLIIAIISELIEEEDEEKQQENNLLIRGLIGDNEIADLTKDKNIESFFTTNDTDIPKDIPKDIAEHIAEHIAGLEGVVTQLIKDKEVNALLANKNPTNSELTSLKEKHLAKYIANALSLGNGKITVANNSNGNWVARNDDYFDKGLGEIVKVFNLFVNKDEIQEYLKWSLKRENKKKSFSMATSFISVPLGGEVNVATTYDYNEGFKNGYRGILTNKNISFKMGDRMNYDFNVSITKISDWEPKRFDWGDNWDNGGTW